MSFYLRETKDQLKLKYEVAVEEHGSGRVTVVFTLADEGRLKAAGIGATGHPRPRTEPGWLSLDGPRGVDRHGRDRWRQTRRADPSPEGTCRAGGDSTQYAHHGR